MLCPNKPGRFYHLSKVHDTCTLEFGCRIWDLLFEPVTPNLLGLIAVAVRDALAQWEPRIQVVDVTPAPDPDDSALVRVLISYLVRETNDRRNLVYPFYVIPHDAE